MIQNEIPNFYNALHELKEIEDVKFFALASLNYQPDGNKIDRDYLPFNIDEIFLALLAEFQLYPLKENVKSEEEDEKEDSKTLTDVLKNFVKEKKGAFYERVHHVDA